MPSQIEVLEKTISRLEAKGGPESPFLKGLRTQLVGLQRQADRAQERERFNLAVNSAQKAREAPSTD